MVTKIKTLFTDIGGVLLTNGWDRHARAEAVKKFSLNAKELDERHHLAYDIYECGKLTLDTYLDMVVFYEPRTFSKQDFKDFMYSGSKGFEDMLALFKGIKEKYQLKTVVISNEGRELNDYRIRTFKLTSFIDFFVSSIYVHFRKPDADIFKIAIDMAQTPLDEAIYIDDRPLFVQVSESLGLKGIVHRSFEETKAALADYGLSI